VKVDNYLFNTYHTEEDKGYLKNIFSIVEIDSEKVIFEEVLNRKARKFIPENFFIKGNKLFLLLEKSVLKGLFNKQRASMVLSENEKGVLLLAAREAIQSLVRRYGSL
jgi:hypothetical protein